MHEQSIGSARRLSIFIPSAAMDLLFLSLRQSRSLVASLLGMTMGKPPSTPGRLLFGRDAWMQMLRPRESQRFVFRAGLAAHVPTTSTQPQTRCPPCAELSPPFS